ncbi:MULTISPECIES: hypothetical protein [Rhodococcus]|uniref:hypothetical protein n=1 Tax=Rhodococcus TaxID=1827 RepID=UPI000A9C0261|nr:MULTISPECIES: hypothetical protein [Rhodococcus]QQZ18705.1 hypothetical protein GO592_34680 [Rhodococcus sp. 21391]
MIDADKRRPNGEDTTTRFFDGIDLISGDNEAGHTGQRRLHVLGYLPQHLADFALSCAVRTLSSANHVDCLACRRLGIVRL